MPQFKCPKCEREGIIPMAFCDEVLFKIPTNADYDVFFVECVDCATGSGQLNEPVKWRAPNIQFAED